VFYTHRLVQLSADCCFVLSAKHFSFFSIDATTDKIFKEFLCPSDPESQDTDPPGTHEPLPPPSHMLPPRSHSRSEATQLRRQVMKKQYSDSVAVFYGQQQRRFAVIKQVSL